MGGRRGVKVLKNNGNNWWQEANRGLNKKEVGRKEKKRKRKQHLFSNDKKLLCTDFFVCSCYRPTIGTEHKPAYCNESWPFSESVIQVTEHFYLIIRN